MVNSKNLKRNLIYNDENKFIDTKPIYLNNGKIIK